MSDDRVDSILDPLDDPATRELFATIVEQSARRGYAIVFLSDLPSRHPLDRLVAGGLIAVKGDPIRMSHLGQTRDIEAICDLTDLGKVAVSLLAEH